MKNLTHFRIAENKSHQGFGRLFGGGPRKLFLAIKKQVDYRALVKELKSLPDELLRDIGTSRDNIPDFIVKHINGSPGRLQNEDNRSTGTKGFSFDIFVKNEECCV